MQPVPQSINESSCLQLHGTLLVRAVSVMIALCGLLLGTSSAFARQIAQAHWIALETRELDQDLPGGPLPTGFVGVDRGLSSADGCGVDYCESSFGRSETTMAFHITGENIAFEWVVQCVADFEAVTLERLGGELTMYVELGGKWQSLEEGDTVTIEPGETALILVISSTPSAKVNLMRSCPSWRDRSHRSKPCTDIGREPATRGPAAARQIGPSAPKTFRARMLLTRSA